MYVFYINYIFLKFVNNCKKQKSSSYLNYSDKCPDYPTFDKVKYEN